MNEQLEKIKDIADRVFEGLKKADKELKIVNSLSQDSFEEVKAHFMTTLTSLDNMTETSFEESIK